MEGARDLRLDRKTGSLAPGKEADIIILDAEAINVAPLNVVPGAVVSLMERSNVETVIVAGKVRKWKSKLLDVDLRRLRRELEASRDYLFNAAGIPQNLPAQLTQRRLKTAPLRCRGLSRLEAHQWIVAGGRRACFRIENATM